MKHPRAAFSVTPSRERQQGSGKAGSTLALTAAPPALAAHLRTIHSDKEL